MVDPWLHHAPAEEECRRARDLLAPYLDASPVLYRQGGSLREPSGLAGHCLPALRVGDFYPDLDPARSNRRLAGIRECRLAHDDNHHEHLPHL